MPFNIGEKVRIATPDVVRCGSVGRIEQVLPNRLSQQDFQEYVVEFSDSVKERFRFCLYREFELQPAAPKDDVM